MPQFCLVAELAPDFYRAVPRFGDVLRSVSPFVSLARDPIVLVFLANADTIGVDVISTKVRP